MDGLTSGIIAALVGALAGAMAGFTLQAWRSRRVTMRIHKAAVAAVLEELSAVSHVIDLMLDNESVMDLPDYDVAYRAVSRDLFSELPADQTAAVVKAYTHMTLVIAAIDAAKDALANPELAGGPAVIFGKYSRSIRVRSEHLRVAVDKLGKYARDTLKLRNAELHP